MSSILVGSTKKLRKSDFDLRSFFGFIEGNYLKIVGAFFLKRNCMFFKKLVYFLQKVLTSFICGCIIKNDQSNKITQNRRFFYEKEIIYVGSFGIVYDDRRRLCNLGVFDEQYS